MSLTIETAAMRIRRQIRDAEHKTDEALRAQCALLNEMVNARSNTDVAPTIGQKAVIRINAAQRSLIQSQNNLLRTHDALTEIYREVGLGNEEGATPKTGLDEMEINGELAA